MADRVVSREVETPARPPAPRALWIASGVATGWIVVVLLLMRRVGDAWWGTAFLLFMPRVLWLIPVLAIGAVAAYRRSPGPLALLAVAGLLVVGPLMGLSLPVGSWLESVPPGDTVRLVSYNLGTGTIADEALVRWLDARRVDVICFQEVQDSHQETLQALERRGWSRNPRGTLATRLTVVEHLPSLADESTGEGRYTARLDRSRLRTPAGREFVVASVHLPTLRPGFERALRGDVGGLSLHLDWWGRQTERVLEQLAAASNDPVLIGGDFNMPADDATMAALRANFRFAFDDAGWGYGYTRPASFPWVRIDHLLTSSHWFTRSCGRGPDFGSDHLPVVGEFLLPSAGATRGG